MRFAGWIIVAFICVPSSHAQAYKEYALPANANTVAEAHVARLHLTSALQRIDADALAVLYADNALAFFPGGKAVSGRADIQHFWRMIADGGIREVRLKRLHRITGHNSVEESGHFFFCPKDGRCVDDGSYLLSWTRASDQMLLSMSVFLRHPEIVARTE